jgi:hypothetical protein
LFSLPCWHLSPVKVGMQLQTSFAHLQPFSQGGLHIAEQAIWKRSGVWRFFYFSDSISYRFYCDFNENLNSSSNRKVLRHSLYL